MKFKSAFWPLILVFLISACEKEEQEEPLPKYALFVTASDGGTVSTEGGLYTEGEKVILTAIPDKGYVFSGWEGSDDVSPTLEVLINQSTTLKANFKLNVVALNENVPHIVEDLVDSSGYILAIENGLKTCYLIDHQGTKRKTWTFDLNLGQDAELAPDGSLFGLFKVPNENFGFGGQSGLIRQVSPAGEVIWEYLISDENEITHHDLELMPNGNLLVLIWYRVEKEETATLGYISDNDLFVEKVVEINPSNSEIVWEWNSWDHIVQEVTPGHSTYGDPSVLRHKIDLFYNYQSTYHEFIAKGDIMHANGITYLADQDLIAMSINFYNEVWFIDHSTTMNQAKGSSGGRLGRGGDLVYRFGNPSTYKGSVEKVFDFNHHPSFVSKNGKTHLLILNNNNAEERSKAMEFELPEITNSTPIGAIPKLIFEYAHEDMFFPRVGGAVRLPNGNTLICEGDFGYWEVNESGQLLWKYDGQGASFWRGLYYSKESAAIKSLGL
jgi:uncharacterized repeat protein (TIGR02543 family)